MQRVLPASSPEGKRRSTRITSQNRVRERIPWKGGIKYVTRLVLSSPSFSFRRTLNYFALRSGEMKPIVVTTTFIARLYLRICYNAQVLVVRRKKIGRNGGASSSTYPHHRVTNNKRQSPMVT